MMNISICELVDISNCLCLGFWFQGFEGSLSKDSIRFGVLDWSAVDFMPHGTCQGCFLCSIDKPSIL